VKTGWHTLATATRSVQDRKEAAGAAVSFMPGVWASGKFAFIADARPTGSCSTGTERWSPTGSGTASSCRGKIGGILISTIGLAVVTALAPRPAVTLRRTAVGRAGTDRITASGGPTAPVKGAGETALLDHGSARFAAEGTRVTILSAANASLTGIQKREEYRPMWDQEF